MATSARSFSNSRDENIFISTYRAANGDYIYGSYANFAVYYNEYMDSGCRTYEPLTAYYRAPSGTCEQPDGFYSTRYGKTYYDGYGFNYYYQTYGYYEFSVHPKATYDRALTTSDNTPYHTIFIFSFIVGPLILFCCLPLTVWKAYKLTLLKSKSDENYNSTRTKH